MTNNDYRIGEYFLSLTKDDMPRPDFFTRIDLCCILAINEGTPVYVFTKRHWGIIFPSIKYTREIDTECSRYFAKEKKSMEFISKQIEITNHKLINAMTNVAVILKLSECKNGSIDIDSIISETEKFMRCDIKNLSLVSEYARELLFGYFSSASSLNYDTIQLLQKYHPFIENVYSVMSMKLGNSSRMNFSLSKQKFVRLLCLIYLAFEEKQQTGRNRELCLQDQWNNIFEKDSYVPNKTIHQINSAIDSNHILKWTNMLFVYNLDKIISSRGTRIIGFSACVNAAIADSDTCPSCETIKKEAIERFSSFKDFSENYSRDDISKYVDFLSSDNKIIDESVYEFLHANKRIITLILKDISTTLRKDIDEYSKKKQEENNINPSDNDSAYTTISVEKNISPLKFIRIMCLLYLSIKEKNETGKSREQCLQNQWNNIFENSEFIPEITIKEFDNNIEHDNFLTWTNMLFDYDLREIKSGKIIRNICLVLCVNFVISQLPHGSSSELVEDEALGLFSKFYNLSAGYEEDDISRYVMRLTTENGTIDDRISSVLWKCSGAINILLKKAIEYSTSENNARKKDNREKMVVEHNKLINELKSLLYTQKANTIFKLIETLTSPEYDYILDRMYRFAYGYDTPSYDILMAQVKEFIQILRLFGANAIGENTLDQTITDDLCKEYKIQVAEIPRVPGNKVVFPGWEVLGDVVAQPIASKKGEDV